MNNEIDKRDKIGIYILLIICAVLAASAFTYYMLNPSTIVPMDTKELVVTQMEFTTLSDSDIIILHVTNPETKPLTVATVKINGYTQNKITGDSIHGLTFEPGDLGTITIEQNWIAGNNYTVDLFTPDGHLLGSYTDTA